MSFWQHATLMQILGRGLPWVRLGVSEMVTIMRCKPIWLYFLVLVACHGAAMARIATAESVADGKLPVAEAETSEPEVLTLAEMKKAFTELMQERAGLAARAQASRRTIIQSRRTSGRTSSSPTARAYREAVFRVAEALNKHPRIVALQEQIDAVQEEKLVVSREQARLSDAMHEARQAPFREKEAALQKMDRQAGADRAALLKEAGVKDHSELSGRYLDRYRAIYSHFTNAVASINAAHDDAKTRVDETAAKLAGLSGSFSDEIDVLKEQYLELEGRQQALRAEIGRLRTTLRKTDSEIVSLQQKARESSRAHVTAADSEPAVAEARDFLRNVNALRGEIDRRARQLRRSILAEDPECKPELNKQSAAGGLALVGEEFWKL